jgi:hypothetical protein
MSAGSDLTRWNRAGLSHFRYVDGNAITFLEELRAALTDKFPAWEGVQSPAVESETQRRARLDSQYLEPQSDLAWEIVRAFARSCHVLGEYIDAYANEGFLRTATQWDSVRKLVAMLDVHPSPPASAATPLVIEAKGDPATLAPGFAVRYSPKDGGAPVMFETLDELALDPALNLVRLAGWNLSPAPLIDLPVPRPVSPIARRSVRILQGIGPQYQTLLDARAPLASGTFTIGDFRTFNPAQAGARTALRFQEAKSKAEILLDFPWTASELASLSRLRLPELLAMTPAALAQATGRDAADMSRLLEDLRTAEIALDEEVFAASRLEELLSPGAPPPDPPPLWAAPADSGISAGQVAIVVRALDETEEAAVVHIGRVDGSTSEITLDAVAHQPAWENWTRGVSSLLAKPKVIAVAHLSGSPSALTFVAPHGLAAADRVAWQSGNTWVFAEVVKADETGLLLSGTARPSAGTELFRGVEVDGTSLPLGYRAAATPVSGQLQFLATSERNNVNDNAGNLRRFEVTRSNTTRLVYVPESARAAGRVATLAAAQGDGKFRFSGKPGEMESGQWVVGDDRGRLLPLRIERIEELEDHFAVTFESVVDPAPQVASLPVSVLMGAGPILSAALTAASINTVGKLAALAPATDVSGLTRTARLELRAKAKLVAGFSFVERDLTPILDTTLPQLLARPVDLLGDELGKPVSWISALRDEVLLLQAILDEDALVSIRVRDLLPIGAPRPVADYQLTRLDRLYGVFEQTIRPSGWNVNDTAVAGARLTLELAPPAVLARGRKLVIERDGVAREATVAAVDVFARTLDVTPPLTAEEGFTLGNAMLRANVVRGGHGEGKPVKVLGSGDAARRSQTFVLKEKDISFVADPTQPSGVAAAVQLIVAGQTWQQVASLRDSRATDPHYEVRLTEDGYLAFAFGDGQHGRRLPTGTNNVRVAFRVGTGLAGNVARGSLVKAARPNPLIASVSQPLAATGGNDREDVASLKTQAPRSVLTLERAVSLTDFSALAARQASVWQARAFALPTGGGRHASVEVVVVPAGGGALGALAADITSFLTTNTLPGIDVRVTAYEPKPFDLDLEIEVNTAQFDRDVVRKSVEGALLDAFSLRRRALGAHLFVSDLYSVVENVSGVESSRARIGFGSLGNQRLLRATGRQVIFLDATLSRLAVTAREFEL